MLTFHLLADKPQYLEQVATWNHHQWGFLRPEQTVADSIALFSQRQNHHVPFTLLAFLDTAPIGMASVIPDIYHLGFGDQPMLNNVYIAEAYRKQGYGRLLTIEVVKRTRELGFHTLSLFVKVPSLVTFYESLGWQLVRHDTFMETLDITIMTKHINNESSKS